jgi:hypothetical protein
MECMDTSPPQRLPVPRDLDRPDTRADSHVMPRSRAQPHRAREFEYGSHVDQDEAWEGLGAKARQQLRSRVGREIVEWWASATRTGHFYAIALGPTAPCEARPLTDRPADKSAYRMRTLRLVEYSLAKASLTGRRPRPTGAASAGNSWSVLKESRLLGEVGVPL